ncbi:DUF4922 domain-containing protein [Bacteroides sp. 519]|uniref:DUF4922 domain-containing protein n=1 Tax=Bacteroides sp. 519 TaxID=2302937 RepID=UPI0013D3FDCE|nr:DUF4922 domain-containing protein [Bacteroides sp. 519]NDV57390.1 DUF4922 domain-containing protein [Bacteroides sp. 519]
MIKDTIEQFFTDQLNCWPEVAERFNNLDKLQERSLHVGEWTAKVVFNPLRKISVTATPDATPADKNVCPLCSMNRPPEQKSLDFHGRYTILINPYPIFRRHFTIIANQHIPQEIGVRFGDMLDLAREMEGYTILYNGPGAGASIPQHAHFQAIERGSLPIEYIKNDSLRGRGVKHLQATTHQNAIEKFNHLFSTLPTKQQQMNNLIVWYEDNTWHIVIILRKAHRPDCYYATGEDQLIISPAVVEMGGVIVTIREEDFNKLDSPKLENIMQQVISPIYPQHVNVGIIESETISFYLHTPYLFNNKQVEGEQIVHLKEGKIAYEDTLYDTLLFTPVDENTAWIEVRDVTIGKKFHWEQKQTFQFRGSWKVITEADKLVGINTLSIEEYLKSVISSEMSANAPLESLKSHAIISRSWLINQIQSPKSTVTTDKEGLVWYDSSGHTVYDVCADDHCQRYQGITKITNPAALKAIEETYGEVLLDQSGNVIDARYSKCCGGIIEEYQYAWEDEPKTYAIASWDWPSEAPLPDFGKEETAAEWVNTTPEAWCNVTDPAIIALTMRGYDQKTPDFYRWTVAYKVDELASIIRNKTGIDFGELKGITPLSRGKSGRIYRLRIEGTQKTWVVGKELEIRRVLSTSHLYSSAFVVEHTYNEDGTLAGFIFRGAGWGHGVGLCQIGAANMAVKGYTYQQILLHYYPETQITKVYE